MPETNTVFSGRRSSSRHSRCTAVSTALSPQPEHQRGSAALVVLQRVLFVVQPQQAFRGVGHGVAPSQRRRACASSARRMVPGLIGWPFTSLQQSTSISVRARSSMASAE